MPNDICTFEGVDITVIDRNGRAWITQADLAKALYGLKGGCQDDTPLKRAMNSLRRLFDRNRDEFTDNMTALLTMETAGGPQQVRIYSTRGAYLMGMLAKTELAKRFRAWVLDVLEGKDVRPVDYAKRRLDIQAMNTAHRHLFQMHREGWSNSEIRKMRAGLFRTLGLPLDTDAYDQGELNLIRQEIGEPIRS